MNPIPFSPDDEPLAQSLRQFQPSLTPLDPAIVFYRMGLEAGRKKQFRAIFPAAAALLLAALLSAAIVGPAGYRLGQASSGHSEPTVPDAEVLPLNPPEPMLAQRQPTPSAEHVTSEAAESAQADVATTPALSPVSDTEEPTSEQPADLPSLSLPPLHAAIANWLWGDVLDQPNSKHDLVLTRRLTASHSGADWFDDGANPSDTSFTRSSDAPPDVNRSRPRPQRREALRASDWKEVVDSKNQIY